jgi:hypothetical protein
MTNHDMENAVADWKLQDNSKPTPIFSGYTRNEAAQIVLNQAAEFIGSFIARLQNTIAQFDVENHVMFWTGIRPGSKECDEVCMKLRRQTENDFVTRTMIEGAESTHAQREPPTSQSNIGSPGL